ncbi:MAG TPA: NAD(P)/FAD-dependent oxidoreductase [Actinomycetota bacterium]|nr:NAD(P)/FAD-dependent oxidoreductase [Actinomycetota bacterium]
MTAPHEEAQKDPAGGEVLDVVVVGGSQSGLAMAWHLQRQGLRFVVLEAAPELGQVWRSRWDSLKLFTPAQYDALPGLAFPAPADTYPTKDPVADYLQTYAATFDLPVRLNARVTQLVRTDDFEVQTADTIYRARRVVVATGPFQVPFVPPPAAKLDASVTQLHSAAYRNPQALPEGPVLVVGGGNSGFQIAEELAATRTVDLSIATTCPMLPQRLAGRDLFWWLTRLGLLRVTVGSRPGRRMSRRDFVIGTNRRRLERAGVRFRPRLVDAEGRTVRFGDHHLLEDVGVVVWATGYRADYGWIRIPGVVREGHVVHRRGVTEVPGLYFLGLSWQHTRGSALLGFVHDDAAYLADRIAARHQAAGSATIPATQEPST